MANRTLLLSKIDGNFNFPRKESKHCFTFCLIIQHYTITSIKWLIAEMNRKFEEEQNIWETILVLVLVLVPVLVLVLVLDLVVLVLVVLFRVLLVLPVLVLVLLFLLFLPVLVLVLILVLVLVLVLVLFLVLVVLLFLFLLLLLLMMQKNAGIRIPIALWFAVSCIIFLFCFVFVLFFRGGGNGGFFQSDMLFIFNKVWPCIFCERVFVCLQSPHSCNDMISWIFPIIEGHPLVLHVTSTYLQTFGVEFHLRSLLSAFNRFSNHSPSVLKRRLHTERTLLAREETYNQKLK